MKTNLTLLIMMTIVTTLNIRAARAEDSTAPATAAPAPVCYSQDDLYRDLKYGRCDLFANAKGPSLHHDDSVVPKTFDVVCPELQDVLKHDPVAILMDFYDKANEGPFLTAALNCTASTHFVKKNINFSSPETSSLLTRYAKKCSLEGAIYARLYGAEDKKDTRLKQKPSEILQKQLDELKIKMAVETDAGKSTALKKNFDDCAKTLAALTQPKIKLEDIRNLKIPTEAKVVFLKQADQAHLGDENIQRAVSSIPSQSTP